MCFLRYWSEICTARFLECFLKVKLMHFWKDKWCPNDRLAPKEVKCPKVRKKSGLFPRILKWLPLIMSKLYLFMTQDKRHLKLGIDWYQIWIETWLKMGHFVSSLQEVSHKRAVKFFCCSCQDLHLGWPFLTGFQSNFQADTSFISLQRKILAIVTLPKAISKTTRRGEAT